MKYWVRKNRPMTYPIATEEETIPIVSISYDIENGIKLIIFTYTNPTTKEAVNI